MESEGGETGVKEERGDCRGREESLGGERRVQDKRGDSGKCRKRKNSAGQIHSYSPSRIMHTHTHLQ